MKALKNQPISKLIANFDLELKNLLMKDLEIVRSAKNQIVKSIQQREQLSVA